MTVTSLIFVCLLAALALAAVVTVAREGWRQASRRLNRRRLLRRSLSNEGWQRFEQDVELYAKRRRLQGRGRGPHSAR